MNRKDYLKQTSASTSEGDVIVTYFYALLAMTCLMGSTVSVYEISKLQANLSALAARVNCSPVQKFMMFLYNISAMVLFQMVVIIIVLAYVMLILGIDFGNRTGYVILTCLIGSVTGVFFGTATGVLGKSEGVKMAITIGGTLFGSFLAGLNAPMIKYFVQENVPIVSWINPASLITDAFYSLYYYDDLSRFFINITVLLVISALFCTITCLALRRRTYASI
jgi:ABC-2 type transport system permease protein